MIIPSIDILNRRVVQLVGGKVESLKVDAGDPLPIALKFRLAGEIAVIDLDAALSSGSNSDMIKDLIKIARCRVGGGIRSVESALEWLNLGASKIILGTAANEDVLSKLPKDRVIAALDAISEEVVIEGWTTKTGVSVWDKIEQLKDYVGGFLITFVEREGRLQGVDLEQCRRLKEAIGPDHELTIAGGIRSCEEIAALDRMGIQAQVGIALYTNKMDLGEAFASPLISDRKDGLFPTVVVDRHHSVLGLVYSSVESVKKTFETQKGYYHSRKRGIWEKGATSGASQRVLAIHVDCDRDSLCFVVEQSDPGFCHKNTYSCFGSEAHVGINKLFDTIEKRIENPVQGSYTKRLLTQEGFVEAKILEEAEELSIATERSDIIHEVADVIYFSLAKAAKNGISLHEIEDELDKRALKVTRRAGDAKQKYLSINN